MSSGAVVHRGMALDIGPVLRPQIPAFHRFTVDNIAKIIPLDAHSLITDVLLAVPFHQLTILIYLSVQLCNSQGRKNVFRNLQVTDAVLIQIHARDKKGRRDQQKAKIDNRLFAAFHLIHKKYMMHMATPCPLKKHVIIAPVATAANYPSLFRNRYHL